MRSMMETTNEVVTVNVFTGSKFHVFMGTINVKMPT